MSTHSYRQKKSGDENYSFSQAKPSEAKPSQAKVLTGGGDLREAQIDVPLSVSHTGVLSHCWAL
jgi:hypothetical protein